MTGEHEPAPDPSMSRRRLIGAGAGVAVAAVLAACSRGTGAGTEAGGQAPTTGGAPPTGDRPVTTETAGGQASPTTLAPTPECADADDLTVAQTEGPYFTPNSPAKTNLYADVNSGARLVVTGAVLTTSCQPVGRALVDMWQADGDGTYDNSGYRLRGHAFTDAQGRYRFETVVPGLYPGRTRHIHVKVQAPNGPVLTTQLYFPGDARNASDGIYNRALEMTMSDTPAGRQGEYDFVVRT
ncbi:MAG: dioxygenase [Actinomycetota bacterium]